MRELLSRSRLAHYLSLIGLLLAMLWGGIITSRCASYDIIAGSLMPPDQEGVKLDDEGGIVFDTANAAVGYADYQLSPTVTVVKLGGAKEEVPCTWKAVRSLSVLDGAESLDDFESADPGNVTLMDGNVARIQKDENRDRTTRFVCEFEYQGIKRFRSHSVRVTSQ